MKRRKRASIRGKRGKGKGKGKSGKSRKKSKGKKSGKGKRNGKKSGKKKKKTKSKSKSGSKSSEKSGGSGLDQEVGLNVSYFYIFSHPNSNYFLFSDLPTKTTF